MAKSYIDADKLTEMLEAKADTLIEGKEAFLYVRKWLDLLPAADVVPRSEVEELRRKYDLAVAEREANVKGFTEELPKAKARVAREIFEEIEAIIRKHDERPKYQLMLDLAELKKKYTEGGEEE